MPEIPLETEQPKKHGNIRGDSPRVRLCGGPKIDQTTHTQLTDWTNRVPAPTNSGHSYGLILDRLVAFGKKFKFNPKKDYTK